MPMEGNALEHYKRLRIEREKSGKEQKNDKLLYKNKFFLVEDQENIIEEFNGKYKKNVISKT
jgi:hypothetical protein